MSDFVTFLLSGVLCEVAFDDAEVRVRAVFGTPDHFEPSRKSYPAFAVYGPVEFRFRNGRVSYIGLSLDSEPPIPSIVQPCVNEGRTSDSGTIRQILLENNISYTLDSIMSDETQMVLVTNKGVHVAFDDCGRLVKIAAAGSAENSYSARS